MTNEKVQESMTELEAKVSAFSDATQGESAEDILYEMRGYEPAIDKASKAYRKYREQSGITDPIMLDEIEEAYYAGMENGMKEEPASDDLEEEIEKQCNYLHQIAIGKELKGFARHFVKWQKQQEAKYREDNNICCIKFDDIEDARNGAYEQGRIDQRAEDGSLIARAHFQGMEKMKEMMEREHAADLETAIEQYKRSFNTNCDDQQLFHIARWFADYGALWQKQQMMNDAVTAEWGYGSFALPDDFRKTLKYGDKLIIVKEE